MPLFHWAMPSRYLDSQNDLARAMVEAVFHGGRPRGAV